MKFGLIELDRPMNFREDHALLDVELEVAKVDDVPLFGHEIGHELGDLNINSDNISMTMTITNTITNCDYNYD